MAHDVDTLHMLAAVITALSLFAALHNLVFAVTGSPRSLRLYLAVKGAFALVLFVLYAGDIVGLWDPAEPHTVGRSMVMALTFMMCTDVLLRRDQSKAMGAVIGWLKRLWRGQDGA